VRAQVEALRRIADLEVELYEFPPGPLALLKAIVALLRRRRAEPFDVVHAHFGLTGWAALAAPAKVRALTLHGSELAHRRTRLATRAVLPFIDLPAAVSAELARQAPRARRPYAILPCGVDLKRFSPAPQASARRALDLPEEGGYLLFPADPLRPEKRFDRAVALAQALGCRLLTLGGVPPERAPHYYNAANAVIVPSEREGFGLAVLEALACEVAVAATPVGGHPQVLAGLEGALCAEFSVAGWAAFLRPYLEAERRPPLRRHALPYGADRLAQRVVEGWRQALAQRAEKEGCGG